MTDNPRSNEELISIAVRDGEVQLTLDEARQFLFAHRTYDEAAIAGVEFMVKGYGAQSEEDLEMYVGGHVSEDIDLFLGVLDDDDGTLGDYEAFALWKIGS